MNRARTIPLTRGVVMLAAVASARVAVAQTASTDSLRLPGLITDALRADARQRQLALQTRAAEIRLRSIEAERMPALAAAGQAQYASRVVNFPIKIPGATPPLLPHDTYDAHVEATESLLDPTRAPRRAVERATLAENQAAVNASLFGLRGEVQDAFFAAANAQERIAATLTIITDLEGRLAETRTQFRAGAALPGDTATIAASILQRRQDVLQATADLRAARARLGELVGRAISDSILLVLPSDALAAAAEAARAALTTGTRARPEFAQFSATRERLSVQETQITAARRPQLSAFARVGAGRPGLDMFSQSIQGYWIAGLQFRWAPWNWGTDQRDREVLELQREIVATNETAFAESLRRMVVGDVATIDRLAPTLALDDSIVVLREVALRQARVQLREGVITAATYLDRSTDLLSARLASAQHRVTLAQARVRLLNTLGLDIPASQ